MMESRLYWPQAGTGGERVCGGPCRAWSARGDCTARIYHWLGPGNTNLRVGRGTTQLVGGWGRVVPGIAPSRYPTPAPPDSVHSRTAPLGDTANSQFGHAEGDPRGQ